MSTSHAPLRSRLLRWVAIAAVVVLLSLLAILLRTARPAYYRDPARIGNSRQYDQLMDTNLLRQPAITGILDSITVRTRAPDILIEMPHNNRLANYADNALFDYSHIPASDSYEGPEGRIWLDHLAVAYGDFPSTNLNEYSVNLPAQFFDRNLAAIPEDQLAQIAREDWDRKLQYQGMFPEVKFVFDAELTQDVKVLGYAIFDARTHTSLCSGYSWGGDLRQDQAYATMELKLWHAAPVELVADLAFGPPEIIEFPAIEGTRSTIPGGELQLIVMAEDMDQRSSSDDGVKTTVHVQPKTHDKDRKTTCLVFACLPKAYQLPVDIVLLDADGKTIEGRGGGTSSLFLEKGVVGPAAAIKTVRVKFYPHRRRLVFHLPKIPGLPAANDNVANLFDVRIPEVRIQHSYDFRNLVEGLTQMDLGPYWSPTTPFNQPKYFEDVSVKELLDEYARLRGPTYRAQVDPDNMKIVILDQSLQGRWQRFVDWLKKQFK